MTSLIAVGLWGWSRGEGWTRYLLAIGLPLILSVIWGVFNVPGDPSRGGSAPVVVPGLVRLLIEISFFAVGAWALFARGNSTIGGVFIVVVVLHYLASYHRLAWLLSK
jgi:hypothetical protein